MNAGAAISILFYICIDTFQFNIMTRAILACNLLIVKPGALVRQPPFFVFDSITLIFRVYDLNITRKAKWIMYAGNFN